MKYNELTNITIKNAKPKDKTYKLSDGGHLHLLVHPNGSKLWRMGYSYHGNRRQISLGKYPVISLAEARDLSMEAKKLLARGIDPVQNRKQDILDKELEYENNFEAIAREWHKVKEHMWQPKHGANILRRLDVYVFPTLGKKPIIDIKPYELLHVIKPIEKQGKHEMAHRVMQTCGQVFRFAIACGKAERDITADLKGALSPVKSVGFEYLQESELPKFLTELNRYESNYKAGQLTRWGMQLIILTFVRNSELRLAKWTEFDFEKKQWKIPGERMKMKEAHIVPLSDQSLNLFKKVYEVTGDCYSGYVFPSFHNPRKPLSDGTFAKVIELIGYKGKTTVHGFRKVASTILHENRFKSDAIERQLAHADRDQIRATYNYAQYLQERTEMMQWYADYLTKAGMKV